VAVSISTPSNGLIEAGAANPAGTATATATVTLGAGDAYDLSTWTPASTAAGNVHFTKATTYGVVDLNTATNVLTYTLDNNRSATQILAEGDHKTDTVSVALQGGSSAAVSFALTGANDAPAILASSGTDSGQFGVRDVDRLSTVTWTVDGGVLAKVIEPYHVEMTKFEVDKAGAAIFIDTFADGNPPPSAPNFLNGSGAAQYFTTGAFTESNNRLVIDSSQGSIVDGNGTTQAVSFQDALLGTNISSGSTSGLREASRFTVTGEFNLVDLPSNSSYYGIRLTDDSSTRTDVENDRLDLLVQKGNDGVLRVQLIHKNAQTDTNTTIASTTLDPTSGNKIALHLTHNPADAAGADVVRGSFEVLATGQSAPVRSVSFSNFDQIFHGEDWTRGAFVAKSVVDTDSSLAGQYGTLHINQAGKWTYTASPNANGTDTFVIRATDEHGASDPQQIKVIAGNGQSQLATTGTVIDGYVAHATVFADANGNGVLDPGEVSAVSDANGAFALFGGSGPIVSIGGTDVSTGLPGGKLSAPAGSTVVTPLTTLVQALGGDQEASNKVSAALGISSNIDLTTFDPVAAAQSGDPSSVAAVAAGLKTLGTVNLVASAVAGSDASQFADAFSAALANVAAKIGDLPVGDALNLSDASVTKDLVTATGSDVGHTVAPDFASKVGDLIASNNTAVDAAATSGSADVLGDLAKVAFVAQGAASDVLQAANGDAAKLNGTGDVDVGLHNTAWHIAGTGDYNGDGTSDVLWFNPTTNDTDLWLMSKGHWAQSLPLGSHPAGYDLATTGDFNGDGTTDVLWQNRSTGQVDEWQIKDGHSAQSIDLGNAKGADWKVGTVGDFNGDGHDDILWMNTKSGQVDEWVMRDGRWTASIDHGATHGSTNWQIAGTGDFNHDGTSDVLWRNQATGQVDEWQMKQGKWNASFDLGSGKGADWTVAGIGDFSHNGNTQVLWLNTATGHLEEWDMVDGKIAATVDRGTQALDLHPVGTGDFNHDGATDTLSLDGASHVHDQLWML
jgi:VCBS repeat-containing protein